MGMAFVRRVSSYTVEPLQDTAEPITQADGCLCADISNKEQNAAQAVRRQKK